LPFSTLLILRSVADDIARSDGEDLYDVCARLACLQVLALNPGKHASESTADVEIGYFDVRAAMASQIPEASQYVLKNGMADASAGRWSTAISSIITKTWPARTSPFGGWSESMAARWFARHTTV